MQIVGVHHGREETDGELSRMEYYIRRADSSFKKSVFSVKHQIPVNGRKKNVIRRFAGKSVVKNGTDFDIKNIFGI